MNRAGRLGELWHEAETGLRLVPETFQLLLVVCDVEYAVQDDGGGSEGDKRAYVWRRPSQLHREFPLTLRVVCTQPPYSSSIAVLDTQQLEDGAHAVPFTQTLSFAAVW